MVSSDQIKKFVKKNRMVVVLSLLLITVFMASIVTALEEKRINKLWEVRRDKEAGLEKLVELSIQYPDYRDFLYRLGVAQWELGNDDAAKEALDRARYLDPNNEVLIKIANSLNISLSN